MVFQCHISAQAIKRCHLSFNFSQKVSSLKAFKNVNCICLRKRWFTSSLDELLLYSPYDAQQIFLNLCRKRNYKFYTGADIKEASFSSFTNFFNAFWILQCVVFQFKLVVLCVTNHKANIMQAGSLHIARYISL